MLKMNIIGFSIFHRENLDIIKHGVEKSKQIEELKASIKEVQLEKSVKTRAK